MLPLLLVFVVPDEADDHRQIPWPVWVPSLTYGTPVEEEKDQPGQTTSAAPMPMTTEDRLMEEEGPR
jgi:hypothetical protein